MTDIDLIDLWRTTHPHADWENRAVAFAQAVIDATREQVAREIEATSAPDPLTRSLAARIARGES